MRLFRCSVVIAKLQSKKVESVKRELLKLSSHIAVFASRNKTFYRYLKQILGQGFAS